MTKRFALVLAVTMGALTLFAGTAQAASFVPIPRNYVYNPNLGAFHDYCTRSPDQPNIIPIVGGLSRRVDFRGPCANHDLCEQRVGYGNLACDNAFRNLLHQQCAYFFGGDFAYQPPCDFLADTYYWAVRNF
ncbi:hypothetical protein [Actinokineospora sp.]|uniref:hypothetical protein n=1 Tax=Actinokineospora sp. TaxID=1872133 RepID=UPI004038494D